MKKILIRELGYYFGILVLLSLSMHPERLAIVESPSQIIHPFLWTIPVYFIVLIIRLVYKWVKKRFIN